MASRHVTPSAAQLASAAVEVLRAQPDYGSKRVGEAVEASQPTWLVPHDSAKLRKAVRDAKAFLGLGERSSGGSGGGGSARAAAEPSKGGRGSAKKGNEMGVKVSGAPGASGGGLSGGGGGSGGPKGGKGSKGKALGDKAARSGSGGGRRGRDADGGSGDAGGGDGLGATGSGGGGSLTVASAGGVFPDDVVTLAKRGGFTKGGERWLGLVKRVAGFVGDQVRGFLWQLQ